MRTLTSAPVMASTKASTALRKDGVRSLMSALAANRFTHCAPLSSAVETGAVGLALLVAISLSFHPNEEGSSVRGWRPGTLICRQCWLFDAPGSGCKSAHQRDEDDDGQRHAQKPEQYGSHGGLLDGQVVVRASTRSWSRWRPPKVAHSAATKAPSSSAKNIHSADLAAALRACSALALASLAACSACA